jgi:hypothetical protein
MQANICKCTLKYNIQVYEFSPPTCVLNIFYHFPLSYLSPYVKVLPLCHLTLSLCNFSPFVIKDHKGSILNRLRLLMSINGVRIIFSNLVQSRTLAKHI